MTLYSGRHNNDMAYFILLRFWEFSKSGKNYTRHIYEGKKSIKRERVVVFISFTFGRLERMSVRSKISSYAFTP